MVPDVWQAVADTPLATSIRESEVLFPALESVHVLSLMLMAGTIAIVDLRILGVVLRDVPAADIERRVTPTTWAGFALMASTGGLLAASEAADLQRNPAFLAKLVLLLLAGLNVVVFHVVARPRLLAAPIAGPAPALARVSAGVSLTVWSLVIVAGRAIAYFHRHGG